MNAKERRELRLYGTTTKQATALEKQRQRLMQESINGENAQEARKQLKRLMTDTHYTQADYGNMFGKLTERRYTVRAK